MPRLASRTTTRRVALLLFAAALLAPRSAAAFITLDFNVTIGPTIGGGAVVTDGELRGIACGGLSMTLIQPRPKLALAVIVDGGAALPWGHAFAHLYLAVGWWRITAGPSLVGSFRGGDDAFALGPEVTYHHRLGKRLNRHELQLALRGDFYVAGGERYGHAALLVARFVFGAFNF